MFSTAFGILSEPQDHLENCYEYSCFRQPHIIHFLNFFGQDDLWDAMEEYKEAKEMMLDIGRQILLKVYPS